MSKITLLSAALLPVILTACSVQPLKTEFAEPAKGAAALLRIGGEGQIAVRTVTDEDRDTCYEWNEKRNQVLYYLEGETKEPAAGLPFQGKKKGMPESSSTRRYADKNRWAEIAVPAGVEIEIQYALPYEKVPGSAPAAKRNDDGTYSAVHGSLCRTGYRFKPEAGKMYEASFSWGGTRGNYTCGAVFRTLPDEKIVRVRHVDPCHEFEYEDLLSIDNLNLK